MQSISRLAGIAAETILSSADRSELQIQLVANAAVVLLVLLVATTLSVYKPRGMTPYGRRKQHEQRAVSQRPYPDSYGDTDVELSCGSTLSTPRWSYIFGIIVIVLVVHFCCAPLKLWAGGLVSWMQETN